MLAGYIATRRSTHSKRRRGAAGDCNCCHVYPRRRDDDSNEDDDDDVHSCDTTGCNADAQPTQRQRDTVTGTELGYIHESIL